MNSLLMDLYRYRERENKSNLEDWLTESLAAIFRSLSRSQWLNFISRVCPGLHLPIDSPKTAFRVDTQVYAGTQFGIPDLVISLNDSPVIVFENKVAQGIANKVTDCGKERHQLHRYAQWLAQQNPGRIDKTYLVFLTHLTPSPEDFKVPASLGDPYAGVRRSSISWGEIVRQLVALTAEDGIAAHSHALSIALYEMLEDEGMTNEYPDSVSFASLELFLKHGAEMENLLARMWETVSHAVNCSGMSKEYFDTSFQFGRYCVHRYASRSRRIDSPNNYLMTGIWFPEIRDAWSREDLGGVMPDGPQVFLTFADDDDDVFEAVRGRPGEQWHRTSTDFLTIKPLHEFTGTADDRARQILGWLSEVSLELRAFLVKEELTSFKTR